MSDGREEREERERRIEEEKRKDREDRVNRDDPEEWKPERVDSSGVSVDQGRIPFVPAKWGNCARRSPRYSH